jgi:hypothetical protein
VIVYLIQATFAWINALALTNEKYAPMVKLHNYGLLDKALTELYGSVSYLAGGASSTPFTLAAGSGSSTAATALLTLNTTTTSAEILKNYADVASQEFRTARTQYSNWQIATSFEALAAASRRIESFGSRIKQDELALYIRK